MDPVALLRPIAHPDEDGRLPAELFWSLPPENWQGHVDGSIGAQRGAFHGLRDLIRVVDAALVARRLQDQIGGQRLLRQVAAEARDAHRGRTRREERRDLWVGSRASV